MYIGKNKSIMYTSDLCRTSGKDRNTDAQKKKTVRNNEALIAA